MSTFDNSDLPVAAQLQLAVDEMDNTHPVAEPTSDNVSINTIDTFAASSEQVLRPTDGLISLAATENALNELHALSAAIEEGRAETVIIEATDDEDACREFALEATPSESSAHESVQSTLPELLQDPILISEELQAEEASTEEDDEDAPALANLGVYFVFFWCLEMNSLN